MQKGRDKQGEVNGTQGYPGQGGACHEYVWPLPQRGVSRKRSGVGAPCRRRTHRDPA